MTDQKTVIFPTGTTVLIVGLADKSWDALEAFAYNHQVWPKGLASGSLVEPFVSGGSLLVDYHGSVAGVKPMPGDRVVCMESRSNENLVSIERRSPDEHGVMRYIVIKDAQGISASRGFMSGHESIGRIIQEVKRVFLDLPVRTF